jgi:hypothetical protein
VFRDEIGLPGMCTRVHIATVIRKANPAHGTPSTDTGSTRWLHPVLPMSDLPSEWPFGSTGRTPSDLSVQAETVRSSRDRSSGINP